MNVLVDYIVDRLIKHLRLSNHIQHLARLEMMNRLEEYRLYSGAFAEDMSLQGFENYINTPNER